MTFFQNPFTDDFEGNWLLGDRHYIPKFVLKGNAGRGKEVVVAWNNSGPYNLSGNDGDGNALSNLSVNFSLHDPKNIATLSIDVTATTVANGGSAGSVPAADIVTSLNSNTLFAERFKATIGSWNDLKNQYIQIKSIKPVTEFTFYIGNTGAETVLHFNARAGVAEMPTYFSRHSIANRFSYTTSEGRIVELNPGSSNVDAAIIDNAVDYRGVSLGYSHSTIQKDWQLLRGKSGLFQFTKGPSSLTVSTTNTQIIYPAGAQAGDLAEKIVTQLDSGGAVVSQFVMPYTLTSGDLITPP